MRAARFHGVGDLRIEDVAAPGQPEPGWMRLRVRAAGICGSDLHNFRTGQWVASLPVTPGHEVAAEVVAVGDGVAAFRPGDLVVADSRVECGRCEYCLGGAPNICRSIGYLGEAMDGGFAEELILPAAKALRVPAGVPPEIAALAEPLGVALRVVRRLDPSPDAPILIAGAGPIGGYVALLLAELGFGPLFIIERNQARAELVSAISGAELLPMDADRITQRIGSGPRWAVEATGSAAVLGWLLGSVSPGARIAMVGIFHGETPIDPNLIVERELDIRGCSAFRGEQAEALGLLPQLAGKLQRTINGPLPLEALPSAYATLLRGDTTALKTLIAPSVLSDQIDAR
jgi:(R,R)-butanediol dehydrogenase/meso-butanediol dehydrogenase/diacetyl reductase